MCFTSHFFDVDYQSDIYYQIDNLRITYKYKKLFDYHPNKLTHIRPIHKKVSVTLKLKNLKLSF